MKNLTERAKKSQEIAEELHDKYAEQIGGAAEEYSTEKHLSDIKHKIGTDYYESCKSLSRIMMEHSQTDFIAGAEYAQKFEAKWVSEIQLFKENRIAQLKKSKSNLDGIGITGPLYTMLISECEFVCDNLMRELSPPTEVQKGEERL